VPTDVDGANAPAERHRQIALGYPAPSALGADVGCDTFDKLAPASGEADHVTHVLTVAIR